VHGLDGRAKLAQAPQDLGGDEVTGVEDEVGFAQVVDAGVGELAIAAREVGVGDDGETHWARTTDETYPRSLRAARCASTRCNTLYAGRGLPVGPMSAESHVVGPG